MIVTKSAELIGKLNVPPIPLIVHLEELLELGQVFVALLLIQQFEEVGQVLQHPDTHLVQVLQVVVFVVAIKWRKEREDI